MTETTKFEIGETVWIPELKELGLVCAVKDNKYFIEWKRWLGYVEGRRSEIIELTEDRIKTKKEGLEETRNDFKERCKKDDMIYSDELFNEWLAFKAVFDL